MIRDRSQYEFVDIDHVIGINDDIMPTRARPEQLRGLDVAFCMEAAGERVAVTHGMWDKPYIGTDIQGGRWQTCISQLRSTAWNAVAEGFEFDDREYSPSPVEETIDYIYPNCKLDVSLLKSDETKFERGAPVRMQPILDVYDDVAALRRFWEYRDFARTSNSFELTEIGHLTVPVHADASGRKIFEKKCRVDARYSPHQTMTSEARATSGVLRVPVTNSKFRHRIYGIFNLGLVRTRGVGGGGEPDYTRKWFTLVRELFQTGGYAQVNNIEIVEAATSFTENHIMPIPTIDDVEIGTGVDAYGELDLSIGIYPPCWIVTELGSHTDWRSAL